MSSAIRTTSTEASKYQYRCTLLKKENRSYPMFSPQKASGELRFLCYASLLQSILREIKDQVLQKKKEISEPCLFHISQPSLKGAVERHGALCKQNLEGEQVEKVLALDGLSPENIMTAVTVAKLTALKFFKRIDPYFLQTQTEEDITKWYKETYASGMNHFFAILSMQKSKEKVSFTAADLEAFGLRRDEVRADPTQLSCLCYAFLYSRELRAKEWIFQDGANDEALINLFDWLSKWNYISVEEPRVGDLVVYLWNGEVNHVGVYQGDGRVHSKNGIFNPYTHTHNLFSANGNAVFFRKDN